MKISTTVLGLLAPVALANAVIPLPPGPFSVHFAESELVDNDRLDPFNSTHPRRLMVTRFTPVQRRKCAKVCILPYMPVDIARIEDAIIADYLGDLGWPARILETLQIETCCKVAPGGILNRPGLFPTIFLGPGINTTRLFYTATAQHLASMGYEVYTLDHPYETDVVRFPNGDIIFGGRVSTNRTNDEDIVFGINVRSKDVSFILDTIDAKKVVYMGHSFGGASAAAAMANESRIAGGVNLDGTFWGPVQDEGVSRPFLAFGSTGHNSSAGSDPSWARFFAAMEAKHPRVWVRELSINGSVHNSYWDMPLIGEVTGLADNKDLADIFFGQVKGHRVMEILREYLSEFADFALGRGGEGLLAAPSPRYPDVKFLR